MACGLCETQGCRVTALCDERDKDLLAYSGALCADCGAFIGGGLCRACAAVLKRQAEIKKCDVRGCERESDFDWIYEGVSGSPKVKICWYHWRLHKNKEFAWNLFDEFGYPKPPVSEPKPQRQRINQDEAKTISIFSDKPCACGNPKLRNRVHCPDCSKERNREISRKSTAKLRSLQKSAK